MSFYVPLRSLPLSLLFNRRTQLKALTAAVLALSTCQSYAAAFSIFGEASGHNAGDFGAGVGAEAYDASTLFYNPAGLVLLDDSQLVIGGSLVNVNSKFSGTSSVVPGGLPNPALTLTGTVNNNAKYIPVPAVYFARKVNDRLAWGVGIYAPYGLKTDWGNTSILRYAATTTNLQIIDVSPAISSKVSDNLSLGFALDIQFADVDYDAVGGVPGLGVDSVGTNHGESIGIGAHAGLMWQVKPQTRVGLNYQSQVQHQFYGRSTLTGALVDGIDPNAFAENTNLFSDPANFPAMTTAGVYHEVNSQWALMASASYIEWQSIQSLVLNGTVSTGGQLIRVAADLNFKNTWRVVGGAKYMLNDKWSFRGGVGYDQTPTNDTDRDIRLPDGDRVGVALGGHYQYNEKLGFDFGWTHLFMQKANINKAQDTLTPAGNIQQTVVTTGTVSGNANIIGAQVKWKIT